MPSIQAVENAIRTWVRSGTGLDDAHVFFNDQPIPRPLGPYVTVRFTDDTQLGMVDTSTNFDETRDPGVEIEVKASTDQELNASIQVWQAPTVTPTNASDAPPSAIAIALRLTKAAWLPSISGALSEAGVSLIDTGTIHNLSRLLGAQWEGRAAFDAKFYFRDSISEFTTFIETAEIASSDQVISIPEE